jgi:predicted acetyltransferase
MRQGYAKKLCALGLAKLKETGLTSVMIMAEDKNPGSYKTIEACGGKLEAKRPSIFHADDLNRIYTIQLGS